MIYFEDIIVGSTAAFGDYQVAREEVLDFARRYDAQPFHLSDEGAAQTYFGKLSASGWHTCSMTMALLVEYWKSRGGLASLGAAGVDDLRWFRPVYPGDRLRCEWVIEDKKLSEKRPEMGRVTARLNVFNQDDVKVMSYVAALLVGRRAAGE